MVFNKDTQWRKRIDIFNLIYKDLMIETNSSKKELVKNAFEQLNFSVEQMKVLEDYIANFKKYESQIIPLLNPTWPWKRINNTTKAILLLALSEFNSLHTDKPIIIDQALKTCDHRGNIKDKKFINAILDKLLK